jgi:hypothetical protein
MTHKYEFFVLYLYVVTNNYDTSDINVTVHPNIFSIIDIRRHIRQITIHFSSWVAASVSEKCWQYLMR